MTREDHDDPASFLRHPKVVKARRLLREAEMEIQKDIRDVTAKAVCGCGHLRGLHGHAHSINYSGGACLKCRCLNFMEGNP
jgi:hypothetical protein